VENQSFVGEGKDFLIFIFHPECGLADELTLVILSPDRSNLLESI
jgi:hypothetical protein